MLPVIGILTLLCVYFIHNQSRQIKRIDELQNIHYANTLGLDRLLLAVSEAERALSLKNQSDPERLKLIYDSSKETITSWINLSAQSQVQENKRLIPLLNEFLNVADAIMEMGPPRSERPTLSDSEIISETIEEVTLGIRTIHNTRITEINDEIENQATLQFYIIIVGIIVSVAIMGLMAYLISQRILAPIDSLTEAATNIADKNWETHYQPSSKDEIVSLEHAFVKMTSQIREYQKFTSRQMVQIRRRMEACFDRLPHPVLFVNRSHKLIYLNPAATRLTKAMGEIDSFPSSLKESIENTFSTGRNILPTDFEETIAIKIENEEEYFLPIVIRIDGEEEDDVECALILQNVTNLRLSDELKSDMVATVSHEIKTPVTSANMAIHLLLENNLGPLNEDQSEMLETAKSDLGRLQRILDHLLEIARLEHSATISKTTVIANEIIARVAEGHAMKAQEKDINLIVNINPDVISFKADHKALEVALSNYVSNALKYNEPSSTVEIYAIPIDGMIRLGVKDQGRGIPPEDLGKIFDKFYRSTHQRAEAGVGLGLSIVKDIALSHNGFVGCDPISPRGCDFWIRIPTS